MLAKKKKKQTVCKKCGLILKKHQFIDCEYWTCIQYVSTAGVLK